MRISVCMATYNGEDFIEDQLYSILQQLDCDDEIIISDDGSSDKTLEIINGIDDYRIKIYNHEKIQKIHKSAGHIYVSKNFEFALEKATGDIIFLSDQDDIWLDGRISRMKLELENHECVICNFRLLGGDEDGKEYYLKNPISKFTICNLIKMPFFGSAMAFKKNLLKLALPFPDNLLLHDNWIGFLALKSSSVSYINEPLHFYRIHSSNTSNATRKSSNPFWYRILYRIDFYYKLLMRLNKRK